MINNSEITNFSPNPKIAGLMPYDSNIEFVGIRKTKQVLWLQNGSNHYFSDLPIEHYNLLKTSYLKDYKARRFLEAVSDHLPRQVELYTYYMYGEVDGTPDIANGVLSPSENFRDTRNCPSLLWNSKNINIGSHILTARQLVIIDCILIQNLPDKAIASVLGVSQKTLDFHKSNLFKAIGVCNKMELQKEALKYKVISI